jgi:hypothetical protein
MFPLQSFIIAGVLTIASNNNMKSFQQFLIEMAPPTAAQQNDDPFSGNEQLKKLYGAAVAAEHEGAKPKDPFAFDKNLYIRTKAGGGKSTAYGPTQITVSTAKGFMKTQPNLFKSIEGYTKQYVDQGNKFLKADVKDPKYGLGCVGDLCDEKYNNDYQKMSVAIIQGKAKEKGLDLTKPLSDEGLNTFIRSWRGEDEKNDSRYYKRFREAFKGAEVKKTIPPQKPQQPAPKTNQAPQSFSTSQTPPSR